MTAVTMPPSPPVKLYTSPLHPGLWIGEDEHGALVQWPTDLDPRGWTRRTPFAGDKRRLQPAKPAAARGTGWPGGGKGRRTRDLGGEYTKPRPMRITDTEWNAWAKAAKADGEASTADWVRKTCNEAAGRKQSK